MNDDRIVAYLRSRGRAEPPLDLSASVLQAVADLPQRRHSPFMVFGPALVAAAVAGVVLLVAIMTGQPPSTGPHPSPTIGPPASASPSASATPAVSTQSEPSPVADDTDLLEPGRSISLAIRSTDGAAGTITIERGEDVGGYPLVPVPSSETHFFVELRATYEMDVAPETAQWGDLDWHVEGLGGMDVGAELLRAYPQVEGRPELGNWPGATVPDNRYEGWMIFAIPRESADTPLELVYRPPGVAEESRFALRASGDAPASVTAAWPPPDPVYVAQPGLPFTVLESSEADALFVDPDTCTSPEGGYTVRFPESWYTNTAIGDVPACSWFSPTFYEATASGERPEEIAIEIRVFEGAVGFIWVDLYTENVTLDGFDARRSETGMTKDVMTPSDQFQYSYLAYLEADSDGRKLWAFTGTEYGGDYELNKAVFDRIMASLEFSGDE